MGDYLEITHGSEKIEFDVGSLLSKNNATESMFLTANKFIDTLNAYKKNTLFEILSDFYIFKNKNVDFSSEQVITYLETLLTQVLDLISIDDLKYWLLWNQSDIVLPTNLENEFTYDPDMNITESKTYIKSQYLALVAVVQYIKFALPVFGEYNNYVKEISKQSLHKSFLLLTNTPLYHRDEMEKLRVYVDEIQNTTKSQATNKVEQFIINKGLCSDDISDNIVSEIFLNKLLNADLYNPKSNIISVIFQTIKVKSNPTTTESEIIRMKKEVGANGEDISFFEDYRKTTDVPMGTIVELQWALGETRKIIRRLKAEEFYSEEMYQQELQFSKDILDYRLDDTQIYLLGWFLGKYINPRALFYIEAKKVVELLTLARIVTWNKGQHFISLLLTSCKGINAASTMNLGAKTTLLKETQEALAKKFSFFYSTESRDNEIEKTVLAMYERIVGSTWYTNANILHVLEYNKDNRKGNRKLSIPNNLADVLVAYIIN